MRKPDIKEAASLLPPCRFQVLESGPRMERQASLPAENPTGLPFTSQTTMWASTMCWVVAYCKRQRKEKKPACHRTRNLEQKQDNHHSVSKGLMGGKKDSGNPTADETGLTRPEKTEKSPLVTSGLVGLSSVSGSLEGPTLSPSLQ